MMTHSFASPWFLLGLVGLGFLVWWWIAGGKSLAAPLQAGGDELWRLVRPSWRVRLRWTPRALRVCVLGLIILALARPQSGRTTIVNEGEGIDIVLALDVSGSMAAQDFVPNDRLYVAKQTIEAFIEGRKVDRIGLVLFAGKAFTQAPLTLDYGIIRRFLRRASIGMIEDGTAIGMALVTATNRLRASKAKSKVVILLTDGDNNAGRVGPATAAELAKAVGVRVHTIGVGSDGPTYLPVKDPILGTRLVRMQFRLDETMLKEIAETTGGKYFRARDAQGLTAVFKSINAMERSPYRVTSFTDFTERYAIFLGLAFALLLIEIALSSTVFRKVF